MIDLIVVGAGPAGLTAALYASRAGASVLVLDGGAPGGKMNLTAEIENYPGLITKGPQLAYAMYEQCLSFGAKYEYGEVTQIEHYKGIIDLFMSEKKHMKVVMFSLRQERKNAIWESLMKKK